jgi:alpha-1,2-mannosyltransferase
VKYNVLSTKGPDLYGTEPWTFYFINGTLNFNLMFLASILSPVLLLTAYRLETNVKKKLVLIGTVFLWLAVFLAQPHKVKI